MLPEIHSLFAGHEEGNGEVVTPLLSGGGFRLEHITSYGAASDPGFWYDQDTPEWVALIRGTATLEFEEGSIELHSGDYLLIQKHVRHRVAATSDDAVWVAIHFDQEEKNAGD